MASRNPLVAVYPREPTLYEVNVMSLGRSPAEAVGIAGIKKMVKRKVIVKRAQKDLFIFLLLLD
jgi:hypothetical protein